MKIPQPKKVLNPKLMIIFFVAMFITTIIIFLLIGLNSSIDRTIAGGISGGLSVLVALGIVQIIAQYMNVDMYIPNPRLNNDGVKDETSSVPKKRRRLIIYIITVLVFIILGSAAFYKFVTDALNSPRSDIPAYVSVIKDQATEIDDAKQVGDAIVAKQPTAYNFDNVSNTAIFGVKALGATFPQEVYPYANAVYKWGMQVQGASAGTWSNATDEPETFELKLIDKDASDTYDDTLANIETYLTYGDYDIAKNDRGKMRWVAARLHAEEIYLNALSNATVSERSSSNVAEAATGLGTTCYYGRGRVLVYSNRTQKSKCIKSLADKIKPLRKAAQNYTLYGQPQAAQDWKTAVADLGTIGYPISKTGATVELNGTPVPPPAILDFQNNCKAIGGTSPSGATMAGLPTTEGGLTCVHKGPKGGTCWLYQTDSGKSYAGGDADCDHKGLLPTIIPQNNTNNNQNQNNNQPPSNPYPFDGTYKTTPQISCSTKDNSTSLNSDIRNFMNSFTVKQGKIYYSSWYTDNVKNPPPNPTIDASGNVSTVYTDADSGATEHTEYTAHFSSSGNAVTVTGNLSGYWYFGKGPKTTCSGTFSGNKN